MIEIQDFSTLLPLLIEKESFILAIIDRCGDWKVTRHDVGMCFIDQFEEMFRSKDVEHYQILDCFIQPVILEHENNCFMDVPSGDEILGVIRSISPIKAHGPNGMPTLFYKKYWDTVGNELIQLVQNAFISRIIPKSVNDTFIILIPKVKHVTEFKHLRPISLCNSAYKIVSKIIALRIKPFLDRIISPTQTTFVPRRWIGESSILVNEVMHTMRRKK